MDLAKLQGHKVSRAIVNLPPSITKDYTDKQLLLPTTRNSMAKGPTQKEIKAGNPKSRIETEVMLGDTNWGKFEPAIRRWESILGRAAPLPTNPDGKDGNHRLSSKFTEWMMGLPDGWITDIGLKRNDELKACGNGVVPQQAELALRLLLELPEGKK
jgi:DNA (cytosine-5)-methyltransferase 1